MHLQIPTYPKPDYSKVSAKLDTSDPTPSVHKLLNNFNDLVCDEEIHYQSRYQHSRPHSAPAKHSSHERSQLESNVLDSSKHLPIEHDQNLHKQYLATEPSSENTCGDDLAS